MEIAVSFLVHQKDAVEFLRELPDESMDLCITDPAYESLEKHRAIGTTTRLKGDWFEIFHNDRFDHLFTELYRVLKKNSHLYVFCDQETLFVIKPKLEAAGFTWWKFLVWDKELIGMGYHYRGRHECIAFVEKGKRKLNNLGIPDVLRAKKVTKKYPTEKPVDILKTLVSQSSSEGDCVLDVFCGSGSTGEAAVSLGRVFVGCDVSDKAIALTTERLSGTKQQEPILSFQGTVLSNFYSCSVVMDGSQYPSVEHAYQAAKTLNLESRVPLQAASLSSAGAKKVGAKLALRADWESVKLQVMESLLRQKFRTDTAPGQFLLNTRDAPLVEGNTWGDTFWGVCKGVGHNHLGRILMEIREHLRQESTVDSSS